MKHFLPSFNDDVQAKLQLKEFWLTEEPCRWSVINYLQNLVTENTSVDRREASRYLLNDTNLIKKHVVAGSVAETRVESMSTYAQKTRGKKDFQNFFNNYSKSLAKSSIEFNSQTSQFRTLLASRVVAEEKVNLKKRQWDHDAEEGTDNRVNSEKSRRADESDEEDIGEFETDIWIEWKWFLDNPSNIQHLHQLSPEKHNVIWCGKLVRRRDCLPSTLFKRLNEGAVYIDCQKLDSSFVEICREIADAESREEMKEGIDELRAISRNGGEYQKAEVEMVVSMCALFQEYIYYNCGENVLMKSESCYRSYLFDECMKMMNKYMCDKGNKVTFLPGEIELDAMSVQLKEKGLNDSRYKYKADGIIFSNRYSDLEILLTEVSNSYKSKDNGKVSFDHHKAMFGMLSMLRTIAMKYKHASFNTFKKVKIHFLHGHGEAIRHWSMSIQTYGVYLMTKEQRVDVPVNFDEKDVLLIPFIEFYKSVAVACETTITNIEQLKKEHKRNMQSTSMVKNKEQNLLELIDPSIIRINEGKHTNIVIDSGPQSAPTSPDHY
ncbi:uncharacterized protein BX663DRAFT_582987 [Cokeromyces recurvatus]|uniref:uncharacterized protein n=1 Tax=Cokeromyces recurvatus TaxID=90255 RepID=UPI00221FFE4D|nr:uncharacterized protein BX663DRAFT_582987 [Cokeromyces recurvatus]KAI7898051.1 hypothetical protein BX663DRAFT_582987 [Cokeromyces recurvatus]